MIDIERLQNNYFILRHGKSKANEDEIIASNPEEGRATSGLTEEGKEQVRKSVQEAKENGQLNAATIIYSSDFARCRETAEIVQNVLGCEAVHLTAALRERFFGTWDQTHDSNYHKVWDEDSRNPEHKINEVESTIEVLRRIILLITDLEEKYQGSSILLVSHGDALQILQTAFERISPAYHRQLQQLANAEIRKLVVNPIIFTRQVPIIE
jgi:probable phosphoglycerate mutase